MWFSVTGLENAFTWFSVTAIPGQKLNEHSADNYIIVFRQHVKTYINKKANMNRAEATLLTSLR